jgi:HSP20 family molecular chaperone IbpA
MQKLTMENEQLKKKDRELEKYKVDKTFELGVIQNDTAAKYNDGSLKLDLKRVELEQLQLIDNNSQNNEIKNA